MIFQPFIDILNLMAAQISGAPTNDEKYDVDPPGESFTRLLNDSIIIKELVNGNVMHYSIESSVPDWIELEAVYSSTDATKFKWSTTQGTFLFPPFFVGKFLEVEKLPGHEEPFLLTASFSLGKTLSVDEQSTLLTIPFQQMPSDHPFYTANPTQSNPLNPAQDQVFLLTTTFGGGFHFDQFEFSVDIRMDIGTPIVAVLDGIVVDVVNVHPNLTVPPQSSDNFKSNYVRIKHDDFTYSIYQHLDIFLPQKVSVGQLVTEGKVIGYSGNSGNSDGPHLHFSILKNGIFGAEKRLHSIPFKFKDQLGNPLDPGVLGSTLGTIGFGQYL